MNVDCETNNHIPAFVPGVQATDQHQTRALGDQTHERAVEDHLQESERGLLEWHQPYREGFTDTTASNTTSRVIFSEVNLKQSRWQAPPVHALSEGPQVRGLLAYNSCKSAMQDKPAKSCGQIAYCRENCAITADHRVLNDDQESRLQHRYAVGVQEKTTQWIQCYPCQTKSAPETWRSLQKHVTPDESPKSV